MFQTAPEPPSQPFCFLQCRRLTIFSLKTGWSNSKRPFGKSGKCSACASSAAMPSRRQTSPRRAYCRRTIPLSIVGGTARWPAPGQTRREEEGREYRNHGINSHFGALIFFFECFDITPLPPKPILTRWSVPFTRTQPKSASLEAHTFSSSVSLWIFSLPHFLAQGTCTVFTTGFGVLSLYTSFPKKCHPRARLGEGEGEKSVLCDIFP